MSLDTIANNTATTGVVAVGGAVDGIVDFTGDQDWYQVTLVAGQQYRFELLADGTPPLGSSALGDPLLRLLDAGGALLVQNDDSGGSLNSSITFTAALGGSYYLSAQGYGSATGAFTLSAVNITGGDAGDVAAHTGTAGVVAVGGSTTGTIGFGGDQDWYRVDLLAGRSYRFDLQGQSSLQGTLADPYLRLLNGAGAQLAANDDAGLTLDSSITFTATSSGSYFLSAQGFGSNIGSFRLAVADVTAAGGDVAGNTGSGAVIGLGVPVTGSVDAAGDQDWYQVVLVAGNSYSFTLQGLSSGQGTLADPYLRLLSGSGVQLAFNDDSGGTLESSLSFTATQSGLHFLSAQAFGGDFGSYRLSAVDLGAGAGDVGQTVGSAAGLAIGAAATGTVGFSGDQDWYAVALEAGHQYRFDLQGVSGGGGTLVDPVLRLLDAAGNPVLVNGLPVINDDSGGTLDSSIAFSPLASGTYYLSAQDYYGATGSFTLRAAEITGGAGDVAANTGTSAGVAIGGAAAGLIDAGGDQDWYRVVLQAGIAYRFDLLAFDSGLGTLDDPYLRLLNEFGATLAVDDDAGLGLESQITFVPTGTGTYYLSAQGFGANAGTYLLTAGLVSGGGDVGGSAGSAAAMYVGGTVAGVVDAGGDQDWYQIFLVAGRDYVFDLQGYDSGLGTLADPYLALLDAGSVQVAVDDDSGAGLESRLAYQPAATGFYYLAAQSFGGFGGGSFSLRASDVTSTVDLLGGTGTSGSAVLGGAVASQIDAAGDQDWLRVTLTAGHRYAFDLLGASSANGTLDDPLLRLLDAAGAQLAIDDDSGSGLDASIVFTAAQSGTHYLSAQGYGGAAGSYVVRAFDFDDPGDVAATTATGGRLPIGGTITGTVDSGGDQDWYEVRLVGGHSYRFDLQGAASGQGSLSDPLLRVMDGSGVEFIANDNAFGTTDSVISISAINDQTLYLAVQGVGSSTGTFRLGATDLTAIAPDVAAGTGTTAALAVGGWTTGLVSGNSGVFDDDWFQVSLVNGRTYEFHLYGAPSGFGTLPDGYLQLFNGAGASLLVAPAGTEPLISSYVAGYTGIHYLLAGGETLTDIGSYTLAAWDVTGSLPDVANSAAGASVVYAGGRMTGTLSSQADQDWYQISLQAGRQYEFALQGLSLGYTLADPLLRLYAADGATLLAQDDNSGPGNDADFTFAAASGGTYYLAAQGLGTFTDGTFLLGISDLTLASVEVAGGPETASTVAVGGSVAGVLETGGDQDWYQVVVAAGQTYRFDLFGVESRQGTLVDPVLRLLRDLPSDNPNAAAVLVTSDDDSGAGLEAGITFTAPLDFDPLTPGIQGGTAIYYLSAQGAGDSTGSYVLGVTQGADNVAGDVTTRSGVAVGSSASGAIDSSGDHDWYRVDLVAGHPYQFDLKGSASGHGSLIDPFLGLYDGNGALLASDDDSGAGFDASIAYTPAASGFYFLSAEDLGNIDTGSFTLNATDLGAADVAANSSSGAQLAPTGGTLTGTIDASGDQDWYAVPLAGGATYVFELRGADTPGETFTLGDPYLRVVNSAGAQVAFDDDSGDGTNALVTYTPSVSGTYYLSAQGFSTATGSYRLASSTPFIEPGASTFLPVSMPVGGEVTGTISPDGERDWYAVSLTSGYQYRIDLRGADSGAGTLADPLLRVRSGAGTLLAEDDDSGNGLESQLLFTAPSSGTFFLDAGAFAGTGTFTLGIEEEVIDFNPIFGTAGSDALTGTEFVDVMLGDAGNDRMEGKAGNDAISGEAGDDLLSGGEGNDVVFGGDGNDVFLQDTLESLGDDVLLGEAGNDTFSDWYGWNALYGDDGDDLFLVFIADADGANLATGGAGRDSYRVLPRFTATADSAYVATDFTPGNGGDLIDLGALLEDSADARFYTPGTSSAAAFLRLLQSGADTLVQWDRDGGAGGYGFVTLLTLKNVDAGKIDSYNVAGALEIGTKFDDSIVSAGGNDVINGADGYDTLNGGVGADRMVGGRGADTYYVDDPKDEVVETDNVLVDGPGGPAGFDLASAIDKVVSSISYILGTFVENLELSAGAGSLSGTGNELNNALTGNSSANFLDGRAGVDTLTGGGGDDTYVVDWVGDVVVELPGGGTDLVLSSAASYTLPAEVEQLALIGAGGTGNGNGQNNAITGNSLANFLDGRGGVDTLAGGGGNDTFVVDWVGDVVVELPGQGTDLVMSSAASFTLPAEVENLTLIGAGGTGNGNGQNNAITGNSSANFLDGRGGVDTLAGGGGNDTYVVDWVGDVVVESSGGGTDLVMSSAASFTLPAEVENLTLIGAGNFAGTGNAANNVIAGNAANNTLNGGAGIDTASYAGAAAGVTVSLLVAGAQNTIGAGTDTLVGIESLLGSNFADSLTGNALANALTGGLGNDTISADTGFDTLDGGEGNDSLLGGLQKDELYGGNGNDTLGGGNGFDTIHGGEGNDLIRGALGTDVLTGGNGADRFVFGTALDGILNIDTITDFTPGVDVIELSKAIFAAYAIVPDGTMVGLSANLTYNPGTGVLQYDADGAGGNPGITFAILGTSIHPAVANDFVIGP